MPGEGCGICSIDIICKECGIINGVRYPSTIRSSKPLIFKRKCPCGLYFSFNVTKGKWGNITPSETFEELPFSTETMNQMQENGTWKYYSNYKKIDGYY